MIGKYIKILFKLIVQLIGSFTIIVVLILSTSLLVYIVSLRIEVSRYSETIRQAVEQSPVIGLNVNDALKTLPMPSVAKTRRDLVIDKATGQIIHRGDYYGVLIYYSDKEFFNQIGLYFGKGMEIKYRRNGEIFEVGEKPGLLEDLFKITLFSYDG